MGKRKKSKLQSGQGQPPEVFEASDSGVLYVVGTPIGNLEDMTFRAVRILGEADAIACEDTRVTAKLLSRFEIERPRQMFATHEHNEVHAASGILKLLREGRRVALCTDAGMPGISDPGFRVISAARDAGIKVELIPGPSAATTALVSSGLPSSSFTFLGFPPRTSGKRQTFFQQEAEAEHTLVLYESPHRLQATLADALTVLGDRRAVVAVELTKLYERQHPGWLSELAAAFESYKPKGEVTVVIAGNHPKYCRETATEEDLNQDG